MLPVSLFQRTLRPIRDGRFVGERYIRPVSEFVSTEALGGIVLLLATAAALVWANSPWDHRYLALWGTTLSLDLDVLTFHASLGHAVNDGLMAVFFFVVGLEIKRELVHGELAAPRKAALPVAAALGGMAIPALIYLGLNGAGPNREGWGIPMATDVAFAMGVLALLGKRAPLSLKVFLLALAIVDDLGAIVVIAVFYTDSIAWGALAWAAGLGLAVVALGRFGVRNTNLYVVLGLCLWAAVFKSGIHATVAGVLLAAVTPSRPLFTARDFEASALDLLVSYRHARDRGDGEMAQQVLAQFEALSRGSESPLDRLEHALHPWVSFLIVPVFALSNAGVAFSSDLLRDSLSSSVTVGVAAGLLLGKPVGILGASYLAVKLGWAELPANANFGHVFALGLVAGIGFTVSLLITGLAFTEPAVTDEARLGIFAASALAGIVGFFYLWVAPGEPDASADLELAADAEPDWR
jgi:NhaA family Na+:H+ antiporter